jgi:hypothetical protein
VVNDDDVFAAWYRWRRAHDEHYFSPEVARILQRDAEKRELDEYESIAQIVRPKARPKVEAPAQTPAYPRFWRYRKDGIETICTGQTGPRMIRGVASTPTIITYAQAADKAEKLRLKSAGCQAKFPIPLRCDHHELGQIGDVTLVSISPLKVVIQAMLWSTEAADYAWENLVQSGGMRCLSAGATVIRKTVVDHIAFAERWLLNEVSIVRVPANPDCTFEVMKDVR